MPFHQMGLCNTTVTASISTKPTGNTAAQPIGVGLAAIGSTRSVKLRVPFKNKYFKKH